MAISTRDNNGDPNKSLLYCSIVCFAVVSWLLWKFFFNHQTASSSTSSSSARAGVSSTSTSTTTRRDAGTASSASSSTVGTSTSNKGAVEVDVFSFGRPRRPPHLVAPENWEQTKSDLSGCLLKGIVPFRSTPAAGYENRLKIESHTANAQSYEDTVIIMNRRERARIFARIFSKAGGVNGGRPPNRGANIAVTIHHTEMESPKLQKVLFLLGTYYNLFVMIDGSGVSAGDNEMEMTQIIKTMRSRLLNKGLQASESNEYKLNAKILPPHRIAFSSTCKGRVAFVRQLHSEHARGHGAELILEFEENVIKELERFGFRVLSYPKASKEKTEPALGDFLIQ